MKLAGPLLGISLALAALAAHGADPIGYNRDIRPILVENCFACHGPDSASRKADLRLDRHDDAVDYGAIVPGEPDESLLIERVFADDPDSVMPPPSSHKSLTAEQKELLRQWVEAGAEYEPHWSFIAPLRPEPPAVADESWIRNPIDRFVLAKLEELGLKPAPEADRRVLARRLSLDLIGLPPDPAEVEAFVNDTAPDAYEKYVERLMSSPRWGEHRARYWLDAARYADTHGLHFDNYREMWSYRDWVIGAFNGNVPFDRFTVEQLAGDLLPNPTLDQLVASGFNRCNITTNEGGTIPEENLVLYTRDRTEATSRVWLGLTANCAVCHDHKFDPLTQREFYEMAAFFNNTTQGALDGNIKDTPPIVPVPPVADRARWDALAREIPELQQQIDARRQSARPDFDEWLTALAAQPADGVQSLAPVPSEGLVLHAPLDEGSGEHVKLTVADEAATAAIKPQTAWEAGHVGAHALKTSAAGPVEIAAAGDFEKDQAFSVGAWVKLAPDQLSGAIVARMDDQNGYRGWDLWIEGGRVGSHIIHLWQDDAIKVVAKDPIKAGEWTHLFVTYDGSGKAAGVRVFVNGEAREARPAADSLKETIRTAVPLKIGQRHTGSKIDQMAIEDLRIYGKALAPEEIRQIGANTRTAWLLARPAEQRSDAEKSELFDWWLATIDESSLKLGGQLAALKKEQAEIRSRSTIAHVMQEKSEPPKAHVLFRGEYDQRRDEVGADTPDALPPMPADLPRNRLGFAQWLLRPEHPLTARVTVNRFWQELFGTGIVKTSEDFGISGELPAHPELLDWLAVEFRESGWDVKRLFRLLVTSSTYRQAALITPEKLEKDPQNVFLSRGPRFRMDGEMIRDYALAAGGLLVDKIGGPSVKPYQPPGVWEAVAMPESNTKSYEQQHGEALYRRSLYTFWKRAAPPASMEIFNAPSREVCTVRRERTNTPLQALVTLNDPQFVEAARHLAQMTLKKGGETTESRMDYMARRLLARPFRPEEAGVAAVSLEKLLAYYQSHLDDAKQLLAFGESLADGALEPAELAGWTMLANQLMNLDEVLNK